MLELTRRRIKEKSVRMGYILEVKLMISQQIYIYIFFVALVTIES